MILTLLWVGAGAALCAAILFVGLEIRRARRPNSQSAPAAAASRENGSEFSETSAER